MMDHRNNTPILYGPALEHAKPLPGRKRRPPTWAVSVRMSAAMTDKIELIARETDSHRADVVRTALAEYLQKYTSATVEHIDAPKPHSIQPALHNPYHGSGKADLRALLGVNHRQAQRQREGKRDDMRMVDHSGR